jgi:two-component sensor histidine kinase
VYDSLEGAACAPGVVDDAVLLVSELVTNAVMHAQTPLEVQVHVGKGAVRVEVQDDSDALPIARIPRNEATGGRGLQLVERIARAWGIERRTRGKVVWFELATNGH